MYIVPLEMPEHCNKCPFGKSHYYKPFWSDINQADPIDRKSNCPNTYGYVCELEYRRNGRYTEVYRGKIGENIKKPQNCRLKKEEDK